MFCLELSEPLARLTAYCCATDDKATGTTMRIAVTGAAGSLGGRVVQLLADRADVDVVAMTRRKLPTEAFPPQVEAAVADYADPPALRAALKGVDTLVFVSSDGPDARVLLHHRNVVAAVAAERVGHVAALSSVDADMASLFCYAVVNRLTEDLLPGLRRPVLVRQGFAVHRVLPSLAHRGARDRAAEAPGSGWPDFPGGARGRGARPRRTRGG